MRDGAPPYVFCALQPLPSWVFTSAGAHGQPRQGRAGGPSRRRSEGRRAPPGLRRAGLTRLLGGSGASSQPGPGGGDSPRSLLGAPLPAAPAPVWSWPRVHGGGVFFPPATAPPLFKISQSTFLSFLQRESISAVLEKGPSVLLSPTGRLPCVPVSPGRRRCSVLAGAGGASLIEI